MCYKSCWFSSASEIMYILDAIVMYVTLECGDYFQSWCFWKGLQFPYHEHEMVFGEWGEVLSVYRSHLNEKLLWLFFSTFCSDLKHFIFIPHSLFCTKGTYVVYPAVTLKTVKLYSYLQSSFMSKSRCLIFNFVFVFLLSSWFDSEIESGKML